jgi:hypothetical protein
LESYTFDLEGLNNLGDRLIILNMNILSMLLAASQTRNLGNTQVSFVKFGNYVLLGSERTGLNRIVCHHGTSLPCQKLTAQSCFGGKDPFIVLC